MFLKIGAKVGILNEITNNKILILFAFCDGVNKINLWYTKKHCEKRAFAICFLLKWDKKNYFFFKNEVMDTISKAKNRK